MTALVTMVVISSANYCRCMWYQLKEPEGLDEFVNRKKQCAIKYIIKKRGIYMWNIKGKIGVFMALSMFCGLFGNLYVDNTMAYALNNKKYSTNKYVGNSLNHNEKMLLGIISREDKEKICKRIEHYYSVLYEGLHTGTQGDITEDFYDEKSHVVENEMNKNDIDIAIITNELLDWYKLHFNYLNFEESNGDIIVNVEAKSEFHYQSAPNDVDSSKKDTYKICLTELNNEWKIKNIDSETDLQYLQLDKEFEYSDMEDNTVTESEIKKYAQQRLDTVESFLKVTRNSSDNVKSEVSTRVVAEKLTSRSYNSTNGVKYARLYALQNNPKNLVFARASLDCTNFVSQCVWAAYGGWKIDTEKFTNVSINRTRVANKERMTSSWYGAKYGKGDISNNFCGVTYFYNYVTDSKKSFGPQGKGYGKASTDKFDLSKVRVGDVIQFYLASYGNWRHSTYVSSVTKVGADDYKIFLCTHQSDHKDISITEYLSNFDKARGIHFENGKFSS